MRIAAAGRGRPYGHPARWGLGAVTLAVLAMLWQALALALDNLLLPTFTSTMVAWSRLVGSREFWTAIWISNQAAAIGFACAAAVGVLLGLAMGRWPVADAIVEPYLAVLLAVPKAALIPVLIMAAGLGLFSRVVIIFSFAVVPVAINTRAGLRLLDRTWVEMARAFGARELQLWSKVLVPGALPGIISGLRQGLARAISGMITVELLLLALGIGRLIVDFQTRFEAASLYATILSVMVEAVVLMQLLDWIDRRASERLGQARAS